MPGPSVQKSVRVSCIDDEFLRANSIVFSKLVKKAIRDLREDIRVRDEEASRASISISEGRIGSQREGEALVATGG